jgi:translation initiation factor IF-3
MRSSPRPGGNRPPPGSGYRPGGSSGGAGRRFDRNFDPRGPRGPSVPMNENIRVPEVRLINEEKEPLGVMSTEEALRMAQDQELDLILVVPDASPPVARLISYSKFNYEAVKASKDAKKKQRESM